MAYYNDKALTNIHVGNGSLTYYQVAGVLHFLSEIFRITPLHLSIIHYSGKHLLNMQNEDDKSMLICTSQLTLLYKDIVFLFAF